MQDRAAPPARLDQAIPVYLINLDRRPDRRAFMEDQLAGMGVAWTRVPATDAETVSDAELAEEVALDGHLIRMGRGSQACAVSNMRVFREIAACAAPAAVVLQDDSELSPDLAELVRGADWIPPGIGLVQLEKWSRRRTRKLLGPPLATVAGRTVRRLHSRTGGAGCFVITRAAAQVLLRGKERLRFPIDHFLFNVNLSPLARRVGVAMVVPCLARQAWGRYSSDISPATRARRRSLGDRLTRFRYEVNLIPAQAAALLGGARFREVAFAARVGPGSG